MKFLALGDLKELKTQKEIKEKMAQEFEVSVDIFNNFNVLIAYQSVGSWGCDSSNFFLLREKKTGKLFENHGSHCSCYGFENQWEPKETELAYLKSDKFYVCMGGYDSDDVENMAAIKDFISKIRNPTKNDGV